MISEHGQEPRESELGGSGRPLALGRVLLTEFEIHARELGLTRETYAASVQLRIWCERNRNRLYIPEWLLDEWGISVNPGWT